MRYLLVAQAQNFFTDYLRHDYALGLVGKGVVVKEVTALARLLFKLVKQLVHAAAVLSAHGHYSLEVVELSISEDLLHQHVLFFYHVDFIDSKDSGHIERLELAYQVELGLPRLAVGLNNKHTAVNTADALVYRTHHVLAEGVFRLVHTGRVKEHKLVLALGQHARNSVAGCLWL